MSWMRRVTEYLGLAPDDEYDDAEDYEERDERATTPGRNANRPTMGPNRPATMIHPDPTTASVRALPVQPVRVMAHDEDDRDRVVVRPAAEPATASPQVVTPSSFAAAQEVADKFKATRPVIMNLQGLDRDLQRRLIDFASGLCYGLAGDMKKVADQVFLLTPADVHLAEDERRRLRERGFDDER